MSKSMPSDTTTSNMTKIDSTLPDVAASASEEVNNQEGAEIVSADKATSIAPSATSATSRISQVRYAENTNASVPDEESLANVQRRREMASANRASLQSGQIDLQVVQQDNAAPSYTTRSHPSVIGRELLPKNEQDTEQGRFSSLRNAFDWRFFVTVICNPLEYVWPLTIRRVLFWIFYGGIAAGLFFLNKYYHWAPGMAWAFRYRSTIAMALIYGLEPFFMLLLYLIARLPEANRYILPTMCQRCLVDLENGIATPSNSETTALVIPCHKTDLVAFFNVLKGAFKHFEPHQIFVVENGNSAAPPEDRELQNFCHRIDPRINYIWSPIASKNAAQYVGTLAAHNFNYIITTDDDVILPWNYRSPTEMITEQYKAVCFPIGARVARQQSWAGADSLVVNWQDLEFKASGLIKTAEAQLCGTLYPHGAASFWDRTTFLDALRMHSLVFYGEDTQLGFTLQRMGKMLTIDASILLETEVPASFLGPPLNYWQQRVRSWEMGRMSMLFKYISHLFRVNGQRTITGFLAQKVLQFYALYSIACDLIRVPLFIIMYKQVGFWQKFALFSLAPILPPLFYKFIKARHRPDLEPALIPVLTFPIYKFIYQLASCLGVLRCIFYYWPSFRHTKTIKEWEREDVFWLDERFLLDPGFLAKREGNYEEKDVEKSSTSDHGKDGAADPAAKDETATNASTADLDVVPALPYDEDLPTSAFNDARSHASRALTARSRTSRMTTDVGNSSTIQDKQRRMEQQMMRLEGSMARVESMLFEVCKRV